MNTVGSFIQDRLSKGAPSLELWVTMQSDLILTISGMPVGQSMFQSVKQYANNAYHGNQKANPVIRALLQLCSSDSGVSFDDRNDVHRLLLDMGFTKKRFEWIHSLFSFPLLLSDFFMVQLVAVTTSSNS